MKAHQKESQQVVRYLYTDDRGRVAELKRLRNMRCLLSLGTFNRRYDTYLLTSAVDGGSRSVLSQLTILHEISNRIKFDLGLAEYPRLCDYFDMIGGIGTGGYVPHLSLPDGSRTSCPVGFPFP